jgi:hypothetical protein
MPAHLNRWSLLLLALACRPDRSPSPDTSQATPAPRFALLSPLAGDTLVEGRTYTIRWAAVPPRSIDIGAVMGGHDKGLLLSHALSAPDSLVWTVPLGFVTGFGASSSDQMRLRMTNADSADEWVETGPFVIRGTLP